jgi:hypothetical protein
MTVMLFRIRRLILLAVLPAALAAACGSQSKTTSTTTNTTHKSTPSAQSGHYHAGQQCQKSQSFAYSAQGFTCVNGKLRHKAQHTAPATVRHSHTNTATPQGY